MDVECAAAAHSWAILGIDRARYGRSSCVVQDGLEILERSGHYPFIEERDCFEQVVTGFLTPGKACKRE